MSDISVKLSGDSSEFRGMLDQSEAAVGKFGRSLKDLLPAASAAAMIGFFKSVADEAGRLQDLSDRLEVSTDAIQAFERMVQLAGGTSEHAAMIWDKSRLAIDGLVSGSKPMIEAFRQLGLSAKDFIGLNYEEALAKIAKGYNDNADSAGAYAAAVEILGAKALPKLLASVKELGEKGFPKLKEATEGMMKPETITFLDNMGDSFAKIGKATKNLAGEGLHAFASVLGAIGAFPGQAAASIVNMFDGIATVVPKANDALDGTAKKLATIKEGAHMTADEMQKASDKAATYHLKSLEAMIATTEGQEKLNALYTLQVQLKIAINNATISQAEKEKLLEKNLKVNAEIQQLSLNIKNKEAEAHIKLMDASDKLVAKAIEKAKAEALVTSEYKQQLNAIQEMAGKGKGGFKAGTGGGKEGTTTLDALKNALDNAKNAKASLEKNPNAPDFAKNMIETNALIDEAEKNLQKGQNSQGMGGSPMEILISGLDFKNLDAISEAALGSKEGLSLEKQLLAIAKDTNANIKDLRLSAQTILENIQ